MYAQNPMFSGVSPGRMAEARRFAQGGQMGRAKQQFELGGGQWNPQVHQGLRQQDNIGQMIPGPGGPGGPPMPPPGMGGGPGGMRTMDLQPGDPGWEPGMGGGMGGGPPQWGAFPGFGGGMGGPEMAQPGGPGGGMGRPPMPPPQFGGRPPAGNWGGQGGGFGNQLGGMMGGGMGGGFGGRPEAGPPVPRQTPMPEYALYNRGGGR